MQCSLSRLYWRAVDPIASAIELAKCWVVDRLCGPFPETDVDRAIKQRGDLRFVEDPADPPQS
jgi:hypothetical protein